MMQIQFWNHTNCFKRYYHFSKWVLQYVKKLHKICFYKTTVPLCDSFKEGPHAAFIGSNIFVW